MQAPPIDKRSYQDLVTETETLAQKYSGWQPRADGQPDAGQALIRVFGRFAAVVVDRLNRAPEKNYLAFLNLIGTQMLPPQPARVSLTFRLAANSPVDALVPAGAQAAAPPLEGEMDEVLFETERSLVVSRAQLQAVYVRDTETDCYSDRTALATGLVDLPFPIFRGDQPTPHHLYLACDELLTRPGPKDITLILQSPDTAQWLHWPITWAYWNGATWQNAQSTATVDNASVDNSAWRVTLSQLPQLPQYTINNREAGWLRAQLELPLPPGESDLTPESVAIGNRNPQDLVFPFSPFSDAGTVKRFYLSVDNAFGAGGAVVRLHVTLAQPVVDANLQLNWLYKVGDQWLQLGQSSTGAPAVGASDFGLRDGTQALTRDGEISFHVPMTWPRELYRTRTGRWLRVDIVGDGQYTTLPQITALTVSYDWELPHISRITMQLNTAPEALAPTAAFFNNSVLDVSKDFYPFGEQPRFNDTFYLACPDALARPGAQVKLTVTLTNPVGGPSGAVKPVSTNGKPVVAWEVWDGRVWRAAIVDDKTNAYTATGAMTISLPDKLAPTTVNGETKYWLRARLVGGNYGVAATYVAKPQKLITTTATNPPTTVSTDYTLYEPVAATFAPPVIKSLTLEPVGMQQTVVAPSACLSYNDFSYVDCTAIAASGQGAFFTPFTTTADTDPALYLGFDQPFDPRPITLYLQVEPPLPAEVAADQMTEIDPTRLALVTWEYISPTGWRPLGALDETQTLSNRGLVSFIGPKDFVARPYFGQSRFWLRARWQRGYFPLPPRLRRVLLNTTWAAQVTTVANEILGSSNSNPGQAFHTAQTPIQPGQQVVVREPETPAPPEYTALMAVEGADAVTVTLDAAGQPDEIWVRWHAVLDFYRSGPRDRHYTVDALTGEIRFGNGQAGLIPPQGQNNIRITYHTGGGEQGNRAAETIVQLKSALPYIDGVTNYEPAQGGAPREPLDRLKERGPRSLRHRDRAITTQDLEDLAYTASPAVARVRALAPIFRPYNLWLDPNAPVPTPEHDAVDAGRMGVIVVPNADAARPTPSLSLLSQVRLYLRDRCPTTADLWVAGPEWVAVTVRATVVPTSLETADALGGRVRTALGYFLHPLTGGSNGQGWAFGRKPHRSDLFALVEAVAGVDHVQALVVTHEPETADAERKLALQKVLDRSLQAAVDQPELEQDLQRWLDRSLVYSGQHEITLALEPV